MKKLTAILILSILITGASAADKNTDKKATATKKPSAVIQPLVIPKDATPNPNGSYSWTDKAGNKWIYSKTPFGISRIQDMTAEPAPAAPATQYIKATDNGDTVKFERLTPFGTKTWEKKKSELTDEERAVFEQQSPRPEQKPE